MMTKGEQTRRRIIAEAASIFNRKGYEGSSLGELMEATGLEKGGVYRHFTSKEQLAGEAFDYAWGLAREARFHDLDQIENEVDRLKQLIANFVERRPALPGGCPLLNTAVDSDNGNEVLRDRARAALKGWQDRLIAILRKGKKAGTVRPDVNAKKFASLVIACLEGSLMISRLERTRDAITGAKDYLDTLIETQIRA